MAARRGSIRHIVIAAYDLQRQASERTQDDRKAEYQYDYFLSDKWYLNSLVSAERNVFQDLSSRTLVGGGLGYQFFDTELLRLSVQAALGYAEEMYANDSDRRALMFRESTDFSYRLNAFGLQFFHRNTFLQVFDQSNDWRIKTETGFRLPVFGRLTAQAKLKFDYMNIPAEEADSLDRTWLFGLNYDW